ncbi:sigma-70 family RNA polymerase sigma factor [Roseateles sp. NT4]|uniref:sigma-70 family RNA polymerase sigma factor n=1 Tax=Roseateles sp. NT4 TaxID=3453715 RepID=UPI003EEF222B
MLSASAAGGFWWRHASVEKLRRSADDGGADWGVQMDCAMNDVGDPSVTQLLQRWSEGDLGAFHRLLPQVYQELRRLAGSHMRNERQDHTLQRTGLVHEVFLRLNKEREVTWESRAQFFKLASTLMRNVLVDHARARLAEKRGGGVTLVPLEEAAGVSDDAQSLDLLSVDQALKRLALLDERQAHVVELRFFCGLDIEETARALEISSATVKREWMTARAWLIREVGGKSSEKSLGENGAITSEGS